MPRPTTKAELIQAAGEQFEKMQALIDSLPEGAQNAAFCFDCAAKKEAHWTRDNNLRDVLIHLYEWHQLMLRWVSANQNGENAPFLPAPYTWKTYGDMNIAFWEQHQATSLEEAKQMLAASHEDVLKLAEPFSTEELFTKGVFPWVGGSTLGSYFVSVTASHYEWAIKKIKAQIKALKEIG